MGTWISSHRKMIDSPEFQRAIDVASQHYVKALTATAPGDLQAPNHVVAAGMCFERIQGMHDFITILMNLAETPKPRTEPEKNDNLDN